MNKQYLGFVIGLPYALFALLFPHSFMRIAHVLFSSLGIVVGLSFIIFERQTIHVRDCLVSGIFALLIFTVGSARSNFLNLKTWIFEESEEIFAYTGVQNWLFGVFFSLVALYLTVILWLFVVGKTTPVQKAGFLGGLIAALPWTLSGKYGIPPDYDFVVSFALFSLLALPGFILLTCQELSVRKGIKSSGIAWSIWAFLVITAILYTSPRMWIFSDNWDFIALRLTILARYLPVWILFSSLVLVFGGKLVKVSTSNNYLNCNDKT